MFIVYFLEGKCVMMRVPLHVTKKLGFFYKKSLQKNKVPKVARYYVVVDIQLPRFFKH